MTIERSAATTAANLPTILPQSVRWRIFAYLSVLIVLLALGSPFGGLIEIPVSFFLKNRLHLEAHDLAIFRLVCAVPLFLSCVFGFIRDTWNPFGMKDRGLMLLFGAISSGLYVLFALLPITYTTWLIGVLLRPPSFFFVPSPQNPLPPMSGHQHPMPGQTTAV